MTGDDSAAIVLLVIVYFCASIISIRYPAICILSMILKTKTWANTLTAKALITDDYITLSKCWHVQKFTDDNQKNIYYPS